MQIQRYRDIQVYRYTDKQIYRYRDIYRKQIYSTDTVQTGIRVYIYTYIQRYTDLEIYTGNRYTVQIYTSIQVYGYTYIHIYIYRYSDIEIYTGGQIFRLYSFTDIQIIQVYKYLGIEVYRYTSVGGCNIKQPPHPTRPLPNFQSEQYIAAEK